MIEVLVIATWFVGFFLTLGALIILDPFGEEAVNSVIALFWPLLVPLLLFITFLQYIYRKLEDWLL